MEVRTRNLLLSILFVIAAALLGGFFALFLEHNIPGSTSSELHLSKAEETKITPAETAVEEDGRAAAEKILPSVVGIRALGTAPNLSGVTESSGSGVIVDDRGYIVTNHHVIADAAEIEIVFADNSEAKASIVGSDKRTDLALLKTEKEGLTAASFEKNVPAVGDAAYAVGNPGGLDFAGTVTKGIVSGVNRTLVTDDGGRFSLIQTDAAINPGNSGGALCDGKGNLIGINVLKISETGFEGMGFAIPAATVREIIAELLEKGSVQRGALGVYVLCSVDDTIAENYHIAIDHGVMISPRENSAAQKAGLADYDIITALNGEAVTDAYGLQQKIFALKPGDTVSVTVWRDGNETDFTVTLEELKEE